MESARSPDTLSTGSRSRRGAGRHTTLTLKRPPPLTSDSNHLHNHANRARKSWRSDVPTILPGWERHTGGSRSIHKHCTSPNVKLNGRVKSRMVAEPGSNLIMQLLRHFDDVTARTDEPTIQKRLVRQNQPRSRQLRPSGCGPEYGEESLIHTKMTFPRNLVWHSAQE